MSTIDTKKNLLGATLRQLRLKHNWTLTELARRSGLRRATLSDWEAGRHRPRRKELIVTLTALRATTAQQRHALELLTGPTALAELPLQIGRDETRASHRGDLLRAMRLRRGWTQEQTAAAIGIDQSRIARWERSEQWPNIERLHALCQSLGAREEELVALTVGYFAGSASDASALTFDGVQAEYQSAFSWPVTSDKIALMDLRFIAAIDKFSRLTPRKEHYLQAITACYAQYADRLFQQLRPNEALVMGQRALHLWRQQPFPDHWQCVVIRMAEHQAQQRGNSGPHQGIATLHHWLPQIQCFGDAICHAWALSTLALLEGQRGSPEAMALAQRGVSLVGSYERAPNEWPHRQRDLAHVLLLLGQTQRAQEVAQPLPAEDPPVALLHAELSLAQRDEAMAAQWLERAQQGILLISETHAQVLPTLHARARALADRLRLPT